MEGLGLGFRVGALTLAEDFGGFEEGRNDRIDARWELSGEGMVEEGWDCQGCEVDRNRVRDKSS